MPGLAPASRIHPLCFEHHSEMKLLETSSSEEYVCQEADCFIHYRRLDGYFQSTQDQYLIKRCPTPPHKYCPKDRYPMYLLEAPPHRPRFRIWRCPKCGMSRRAELLS